jgi:hypothetical protein
MPAAMGSGHRINKRTSNLNILLAEKVVSVPKSKKASAKKESKIVKKEKVTKTTKKSK